MKTDINILCKTIPNLKFYYFLETCADNITPITSTSLQPGTYSQYT